MRSFVFSLSLLFTTAAADFDLSGTYSFRVCEPVVDERLAELAVQSYDHVEIKPTTHALDICYQAYRVNWRIENHMSAVLCGLDIDSKPPAKKKQDETSEEEQHTTIRIDNVHKTRRMPKDPHNMALENALTEALPLITQLSFVDDMVLLEHENKICIGLQKLVTAGGGSDEFFGEDNN